MIPLMRKEKGRLAVEWVDDGAKQADNEGGEALLSCRFFYLEGDSWLPIEGTAIATQVRRGEDDLLLEQLLDLLLEKVTPLKVEITEDTAKMPEGGEIFSRLVWFGPEMAEEY